MQKIREIVNGDTIIGNPIAASKNTTIIPVSKIVYGFAAGGSDFQAKKNESKDLFGGGSGAGITICPIAIIIINGDDVKVVQVEPSHGSLDNIVGMAPEIIEKIKSFFKSHKNPKKNTEKEENVE
jgi:sporulation protein YtfJ